MGVLDDRVDCLGPLDGSRLSKHAFMLLPLLSLIGFEKVIYSRWLPGFRVSSLRKSLAGPTRLGGRLRCHVKSSARRPERIAVNQAVEGDSAGFIDLAEQCRTVVAGLVH
jgi:hypothetical protein